MMTVGEMGWQQPYPEAPTERKGLEQTSLCIHKNGLHAAKL